MSWRSGSEEWRPLLLHDVLPDPGKERYAVRERVKIYLPLNLVNIPKDPWSPIHWGHDAALSALKLWDSEGQAISLTPDFDPEITSYSAPGDVRTIIPTTRDTRAKAKTASSGIAIAVKVTAQDGTTTKTYKVTLG